MKDEEIKLAKKGLKSYCTTRNIFYTEEDLTIWGTKIIEIVYAIGGSPSKEIFERMIPTYMEDIIQINSFLYNSKCRE